MQRVEPLREGAPEDRLVGATPGDAPVLLRRRPRIAPLVDARVGQALRRLVVEPALLPVLEHRARWGVPSRALPGWLRFARAIRVPVFVDRDRVEDVLRRVLRVDVVVVLLLRAIAPARQADIGPVLLLQQHPTVLLRPQVRVVAVLPELLPPLSAGRLAEEGTRQLVGLGGLELAVRVVVVERVELGASEPAGEGAQAVQPFLAHQLGAVVDREFVPVVAHEQLERVLVHGGRARLLQVRVGGSEQRREHCAIFLRELRSGRRVLRKITRVGHFPRLVLFRPGDAIARFFHPLVALRRDGHVVALLGPEAIGTPLLRLGKRLTVGALQSRGAAALARGSVILRRLRLRELLHGGTDAIDHGVAERTTGQCAASASFVELFLDPILHLGLPDLPIQAFDHLLVLHVPLLRHGWIELRVGGDRVTMHHLTVLLSPLILLLLEVLEVRIAVAFADHARLFRVGHLDRPRRFLPRPLHTSAKFNAAHLNQPETVVMKHAPDTHPTRTYTSASTSPSIRTCARTGTQAAIRTPTHATQAPATRQTRTHPRRSQRRQRCFGTAA